MPPHQECRLGNEIVFRATYYQHIQSKRDEIPLDSNDSKDSSSSSSREFIIPPSSLSSSIAPIRTITSKSPSKTNKGSALHLPLLHPLNRDDFDFETIEGEVDMLATIRFVEGGIPKYPSYKCDMT